MKVKAEKLNNKQRDKFLDALYACASSLKSQKEIKYFIRDFLTESEKIMIGRRILIVQRLLYKQPRDQIIREMGVGLDTIYKIQNWLNPEGYKNRIKKLNKSTNKTNSKFKDYYPSGPFADIKRRYKSHYLLSNLLKELNK